MSQTPNDPLIGRKIGPYTLVRKLGQGGMGAVYLGQRGDQELVMNAAIKVAHASSDSAEMVNRFLRERQLLARLKHPYIGMLLDAGTTEEGAPFFIMEHVEGDTIDRWCVDNHPSLTSLLQLFRKIAGAVGFAHGKGVIHRDLKPGNIMVTQEGEPKLLDFGIAHLGGGDLAMTRPGEILLTPEYAAPEQWRGGVLTPACDIYALGLVLMELLYGKAPTKWGCEHLEAVTRLITEGRPASDSMPLELEPIDEEAETKEIGADQATRTLFEATPDLAGHVAHTLVATTTHKAGEPVPEALGHVLRTALAPDPTHRFTSIDLFIEGLDRVLATMPDQKKQAMPAKFDTLLWYHPDDRQVVMRLAKALAERDIRVWLDVAALKPGTDPSYEMGRALDVSRSCLVCLGSQVPWNVDAITRDRLAFRSADIHVLPVLLPEGAYPEKQSQLPSFLRGRLWTTLSGGLDPLSLDKLAAMLRDIRIETEEAREPTGICPFRGLEVFREEDRDYFFGREALSQQILVYLRKHRFIAVLGPSGSGKSSVIRAGVMPALSDQGFRLCLMRPTAEPLFELATNLAHCSPEGQPPEMLLRRMKSSPEALFFIVKELLEQEHITGIGLVIDQLEELFTLASDKETTARFIDLLCFAMDQNNSPLTVIVTMRSDFLGKAVAYPQLNNYLLDNALQVSPMDREMLTRAIKAPTRLAGLRLEPGLLERILDAVAGAPSELPLMEHALLELFERRDQGKLTLAAYEDIGGIEGALARRAEAEYARLHERGRETLRRMFTLCLVQPGEGTEDTRRRATREELYVVGFSRELVDNLLDRWMNTRLLTGSGENERGSEWVDVAHEALIRKWDRLRGWMAEDRETARHLGRLRKEARAWQEADRDRDLLPRGGPLWQLTELADNERDNLGVLEKAYIRAALAQNRRRRMFAVLLGGLGFVLAGIAFTMFLTAKKAQQMAVSEKALAQQRTREAHYNLAMMFDEKAGTALAENRPQEAWVYAMAALSRDIAEDKTLPTTVGRFANPAMEHAGRMLWSSPVATPARRAAMSADGRILALAGRDHGIRLIETRGGAPIAVLRGHSGAINGLAFSAMGNLASGGEDREVRLWPQGSRPADEGPMVLKGHEAAVSDVIFVGTALVAADITGKVLIWDEHSGDQRGSWATPSSHTRLTAHGSDILYYAGGGFFGRIDVDRGPSDPQPLPAPAQDLCMVDGQLVLALMDGRILVIDPENGEVEETLRAGTQAVSALAPVTGTSQWLSLSRDGRLCRWDLDGKQPIQVLVPGLEASPPPDQDEPEEGEDDEKDEDDDEDDEKDEDEVLTEGSAATRLPALADADLALASNGLVAAVRSDALPELRSLDSGEIVAVMPGHSGDVICLAFAPDGQWLASGSADSDILLWHVPTGGLHQRLRGHEDEVLALAYAPDGQVLASASADETIRLWSTADPSRSTTLTGHDDEVTGLSFSPDGTLLASASLDGTIRLWDWANGRLLKHKDLNHGPIADVTFSPNGKLLAAASWDHKATLWRVPELSRMGAFTGHTSNVSSICFAPDGSQFATTSDDQTIRIWDLATWRSETLSGHSADVARVQFSPDGAWLASGSDDQTVKIWSVAERREIATFTGHAAAVVDVVFSPDGKTLASASEDRSVRLWDLAGHVKTPTLSGHRSAVVGLSFSPDGALLASASEDRTIRIWNMAVREQRSVLEGHEADISSVVFSPDGRLLASASDDRSIRLWRMPEGRLLDIYRGHEADVSDLAFSPDGTLLASSSDDGSARLWRVEDGELVGRVTGHQSDVVAVAFSPDGLLLATASDDGLAKIWPVARILEQKETSESTFILRGHAADVTGLAFHPKGRWLATTSLDKSVKLWRVDDGEVLATLTTNALPMAAVSWSADGLLLAASNTAGGINVWTVHETEAALVRPLATLAGHEGEVAGLTFAPQGDLLASGGGDDQVRLWQTQDLRKVAEAASDRRVAGRLFNHSLHHFGYRLDGFQMVHEPRFFLQPLGAELFQDLQAYAQPRPRQLKLLQWLSDEKTPTDLPDTR